jgi:hypothetical protein
VREARDAYLAKNGFSVEAYRAQSFSIDVFGRTWTLKNPRARMRAVPLHDLHHVATGYGTDLIGEAETSAFELRGGIDSFFLWVFKLSAITIGLFLAPGRVIRAFRRAAGARALYEQRIPYDELLTLSVGELRARLGIAEGGAADREAALHRRAPA